MAVKGGFSTTSVLASSGEHGAVSVDIDDVLVGKYKVESILGQGGMGVVVSAMHIQLQERVALKFLRPGAGRSEEFNARFLREAQVTAKLRNEHIVKVSDVGTLESGAPYMVMEYVSGQNLRAAIKSDAPMTIHRAVDYIVQACEGLAEAHSLSVIHRDLKPSNLIITTRRDGSELVKVLDFGISKANLVASAEIEDLTAAGALLGSPKYMSPEQLTNTADVDERTDVWSLAIVLYEMLAGKPPFVAETHATTCMRVLGTEPPPSLCDLRDDISPEFEAAIFRALNRDRNLRTPNVAEFAEDVVNATQDLLPDSVIVSIQRIRRTIESHGMHVSGTVRPDRARLRPLSDSASSSGSHRSASGAVVSAHTEQPRRRGLWIAFGVAITTIVVLIAVLMIRGPEDAEPDTTLAVTPVSPSTEDTQTQPPSSADTAQAPPADDVPEDAAAKDVEEKDVEPEAKEPVRRPPVRYVPPRTPPPATTPTTPTATTTRKIDPLEERQ